ncbi:uncharacterized protein PG998_014207 [Apiospora kogelbergensis]|uniref:uncharacterized protein n=1 Tax=Apiospora kogelbergensis TaxID=1337665 RepID=UPI00312EF647
MLFSPGDLFLQDRDASYCRHGNHILRLESIFEAECVLPLTRYNFTLRLNLNFSSSVESRMPQERSKFYPLLSLVGGVDTEEERENLPEARIQFYRRQAEAFINTPLFTSGVDEFIQSEMEGGTSQFTPQYANMNIPWSTFICGSQGAGKSHTVSCLLESYIDKNSGTGKLPNPLSGMVMHYDNFTNDITTQLCESAYLCSSGVPVNVLVCPSSIWAMKRLYSNLPGLEPGSPRPKILPLYLTENQLNISRIMKLMAVDPTSGDPPLYMEVVMNIIRQMAMEGPKFSYTEFRRRLAEVGWIKGQNVALNMRLQLLDTFLAPSPFTQSTRPAQAEEDIWTFAPGSLTIVDLSDPFVSSDDACALFSICLSIFLEDRGTCGRVVAMDEAHKFLVQSGSARILTGDLTSIIRQQRHTGTRVIIATQEPTLAPELIDLANATFVHRFLSPAWYEILKKHLAGADKKDLDYTNLLFETIVTLETGQALLFCPTAQLGLAMSDVGLVGPKALGNRYAKLKIRKRTAADGGRSIMATDASAHVANRAVNDVPMFVVVRKPQDCDKAAGGKEDARKNGDRNAINNPKESSSNASHTFDVGKNLSNTKPSKSQVKKAAYAQFKDKDKEGWGALEELVKSQKSLLYSDAESHLNVVPGTLAKNTDFRTAFNKVYSMLIAQSRTQKNT